MRDITEREDLIIANSAEPEDYMDWVCIRLKCNGGQWAIPHYILAGIVNGATQPQAHKDFFESNGMRFDYAITNAELEREHSLRSKPRKQQLKN